MDLGAQEALPASQLCLFFRMPDPNNEAEDPEYVRIRPASWHNRCKTSQGLETNGLSASCRVSNAVKRRLPLFPDASSSVSVDAYLAFAENIDNGYASIQTASSKQGLLHVTASVPILGAATDPWTSRIVLAVCGTGSCAHQCTINAELVDAPLCRALF